MSNEIEQLRTALREMLDMPHGGRRAAVDEQTRRRVQAYQALIDTASDNMKQKALFIARAHADRMGRTAPTTLEEAVSEYGYCIIVEAETP